MKQKKYWWLDAFLFVGLLAAFYLSLTGVELHQWIGILGGLLALYHLLTHWDWVSMVNQHFFDRARWNVRLKFILDAALLIGFSLIVISGLSISSWLDLALAGYLGLLKLHIIASIATLVILVCKLGLHWKWILYATRSIFSQPKALPAVPAQFRPAPVDTQSMHRREFLSVLGVVGGASLLALISASSSLAQMNGGETASSTQTSTTSLYSDDNQPSANSGMTSSAQSANGDNLCSFQCGRRYSYPGKCRRYTDSDQDNYCDYGECA